MVTREEAIAQLEAKAQHRKDVRAYNINRNVANDMIRIFGVECYGKWHDITYNEYDYIRDCRFTAEFFYDSFRFKIKVKPGYLDSVDSTLYIRTKRKWKKVSCAEDILKLIEKGKL